MFNTSPQALIIDDNFHNRDIFRIALETVGFTTMQAENGFDGLKILSRETFQMLVLDLQMPLMDGVEMLKQLRTMPLHQRMCVVVVTANAYMVTSDVSDLADFVMHKPVDVREFAEFAQRLKRSLMIA